MTDLTSQKAPSCPSCPSTSASSSSSSSTLDRPYIQIAPMMDVTYRDFRYLMRLLSKKAQLWTEMVVDDTILHNLEPQKCDRFLGFDKIEHPIVCQVGGSDPVKLAEVAPVVERYGYDELNLNCGCPSDRVSKGEFGCSLMKKQELVRDIVRAMNRAVQIPVTVKCRLGVDDLDSQDFTKQFISTVAAAGCKHFQLHARKAWLHGLSPAQNRSVPPLQYARVKELCKCFPDLQFSINGGIADTAHARALLGFPQHRLEGEDTDIIGMAWDTPGDNSVPENLVGAMIGRGAMNNPMMLWDVDRCVYGAPQEASRSRRSVLTAYQHYLEEVYPPEDDVPATARSVGSVHLALKPTLGIFSGLRGHRAFRGALDALMRDKDQRRSGPGHLLEQALKKLDEANPGLLDEPLAPTTAHRPQPKKAPEADVKPPVRKRKRGSDGNDALGQDQERHQPCPTSAPAVVEHPETLATGCAAAAAAAA